MRNDRVIIAGVLVLALAGMSVCADTGALASFNVGAGEVQSVAGGKKSTPLKLDGFTKTGAGTVLFDGPARVSGLVVARAYWVYPEDASLGDMPLAMPKPSAKTSKNWSMRVNGDNTTLSLILATPARVPLTGFAALAAENLR